MFRENLKLLVRKNKNCHQNNIFWSQQRRETTIGKHTDKKKVFLQKESKVRWNLGEGLILKVMTGYL